MSRSFNATDSGLSNSTAAPVAAAPLTLVAWYKPTNVAADVTLVGLNLNGASGAQQFTLRVLSTGVVQGETRTSSGTTVNTANTVTDDAWNMAAYVTASSASRFAYLNGTLSAENTGNRTPTGINEIQVGRHRSGSSSFNQFADGLIAYVVIWDIALSESELDTLYNAGAGGDPTAVQNADIVGYWDLTGNESPEVDDVGALDLTVTNATFSTDNPFTLGGGGGAVIGSGLTNGLRLSRLRLAA